MFKKARQGKHGSYPTVLSRWHEQEGYRKSLAEHNIGEKEIMLYDSIALERHDYTATRAGRLQNAKHWVLRLNADGPRNLFDSDKNLPMNRNNALMQDAYLTETEQTLIPIRSQLQHRQRQNQQFEGGENFDYYVYRKTGWRYYREPRRNPPAAFSSSSSTSQWPTSQWQTSWSSWQPTPSEKWC